MRRMSASVRVSPHTTQASERTSRDPARSTAESSIKREGEKHSPFLSRGDDPFRTCFRCTCCSHRQRRRRVKEGGMKVSESLYLEMERDYRRFDNEKEMRRIAQLPLSVHTLSLSFADKGVEKRYRSHLFHSVRYQMMFSGLFMFVMTLGLAVMDFTLVEYPHASVIAGVLDLVAAVIVVGAFTIIPSFDASRRYYQAIAFVGSLIIGFSQVANMQVITYYGVRYQSNTSDGETLRALVNATSADHFSQHPIQDCFGMNATVGVIIWLGLVFNLSRLRFPYLISASLLVVATFVAAGWVQVGQMVVDDEKYSFLPINSSMYIAICLVFFITSSVMMERTGRKEFFFSIQREVLRELQAIDRQVAEESKRKSDWFANVAHEIRTPIHGIIGLTSVMRETHLDNDQVEALDGVDTCCYTLNTLINDIMDMAKLEAKALKLHPSPICVRTVVEDICYTLAPKAQQKGIGMDCWVDVAVPDTLMADRGRISQILNNLLSNAIKFSSSGVIRVQVEVEQRIPALSPPSSHSAPPSSITATAAATTTTACTTAAVNGGGGGSALMATASTSAAYEQTSTRKEGGCDDSEGEQCDGGEGGRQKKEKNMKKGGGGGRRGGGGGGGGVHLHFHVADQGIGIDKEGLNKLFGRFNSLSPSINESTMGTGIGLFLTKAIVEKMGGKVNVESEKGKGSVFSFSAVFPNVTESEKEGEVSSVQRTSNIEMKGGVRAVVGVENDIQRNTLCYYLQGLNVEVVDEKEELDEAVLGKIDRDEVEGVRWLAIFDRLSPGIALPSHVFCARYLSYSARGGGEGDNEWKGRDRDGGREGEGKGEEGRGGKQSGRSGSGESSVVERWRAKEEPTHPVHFTLPTPLRLRKVIAMVEEVVNGVKQVEEKGEESEKGEEQKRGKTERRKKGGEKAEVRRSADVKAAHRVSEKVVDVHFFIVEDNPLNISILKRQVKTAVKKLKLGKASIAPPTFSTFSNGRDAVECICKDVQMRKESEVELGLSVICTDLNIEGDMSGIGVAVELRKKGVTLPIICMTGHTKEEKEDECMAAGMNGFLSKPFSGSELEEVLASTLHIKRVQPPSFASCSLSSLAAINPATSSHHSPSIQQHNGSIRQNKSPGEEVMVEDLLDELRSSKTNM